MAKITIRPAEGTYCVRAGGAVLGETTHALELREEGHDPVIYVPREDVAMAFLDRSGKSTHCPHKGDAAYYSVVTKSVTIPDAVWTYEEPEPGVAEIKDHLAFQPGEVTVERV
ncbi:uncharacterized protein (DUF427 family) [Hasllibacter halocynthiae]|uniref:Uncharacterized protein (DUF427 family) n=1 Tax=Hasllibacter halocynthiae TaxID=595589 RepID=A0A2T0X9H1_9RHOB|nr:DUF427 domain-containing protein [Hasllibacter halocynthiae]PRY95565.1 uncharacterized protein (DUF427 family) [Hasllibacter halocynthiae]